MDIVFEVIFITTSDPEINVARVAQRVSKGGHDVPREKIISRYYKSMRFLPQIIEVADIVKVYDNSGEHPLIVFFKKADGSAVLLNKEIRPRWVDDCIHSISNKKGILDLNQKETKLYIEDSY